MESLNSNIEKLSYDLTRTLKLLNITKLKFSKDILKIDINYLNALLKIPKLKKLQTEEEHVIANIESWINNNHSTDLESLNASIKSISSKLTTTLKILNLTKLQFAESVLDTNLNFLDSLLKTPKIKELENEEKKLIEKIEHWINNNKSTDLESLNASQFLAI